MSSLAERMLKLNKNSNATIASKSELMNNRTEAIDVKVPMLNLALGGDCRKGLVPGIVALTGQSKSFKTSFAFKIASEYLKADKEAICIFYDCEFGSRETTMKMFDVDTDRVIHIPFTNLEELSFDIMPRLEEIKRGDKVIFLVDSIGNAPSKKELDNALDGNSAQDMQRAKYLKSLFRMITPQITMKGLCFIGINHTYNTMDMFSKQVVSGGSGLIYSANSIFIITRSQNKNSKGELEGYNFTINIEKSRDVREGSKIPITVKFDSSIEKYSGILPLAIELGYVSQEGRSHIKTHIGETSKVCLKNLSEEEREEWFEELVTNTDLYDAINAKYSLIQKPLYNDTEQDSEEEE